MRPTRAMARAGRVCGVSCASDHNAFAFSLSLKYAQPLQDDARHVIDRGRVILSPSASQEPGISTRRDRVALAEPEEWSGEAHRAERPTPLCLLPVVSTSEMGNFSVTRTMLVVVFVGEQNSN
jgi:hypothetical protein